MSQTILSPKLLDQIYKDRKIRTAITTQNHLLFFHVYFAKYVTHETALFQKELFSITEDENIPLAVIVAFRGSGKSTIMNMSYPIWSILGRQQKKFVVMLSQTQRQARQHLMNLKRELEQNDLLKADLGPFQEQTDEWGSYALVIPGYDAKIMAASTEQSIRGLRHGRYRPDLIICDDVEDLESVKNKESRDKTHQWLTGDVIPAGDPDTTRIIVVGNLLHEDSVLMRLKEGIETGKHSGIYRAYPLLDDNEKCLWPGKYPDNESIERLKKIVGDEASWYREYLLRIMPNCERVIDPDWLCYYEKVSTDKKHYMFSAISIDLAISQRATADYTAMIAAFVYEVSDRPLIYILPNIINQRLSFPDTVQAAKSLASTVRNGDYPYIYVEDVGYQRAFIHQIQEDYCVQVKGVNFGRLDKRARLAMASNTIQQGYVLFPKKGAEELIDQITNFGVARHDDLADAFSMLILKIMETSFNTPKIFFV